MNELLSRSAVSALEGDEAQDILGEYLATGAEMVLSRSLTVQAQPSGTGAGDKLLGPR